MTGLRTPALTTPQTQVHFGLPQIGSCLVPLGSPSCCSSLDKDSPSTLCLAALVSMKLSTATVAFTSPDSEGTQGRVSWYASHRLFPMIFTYHSLSHKHCPACWEMAEGMG